MKSLQNVLWRDDPFNGGQTCECCDGVAYFKTLFQVPCQSQAPKCEASNGIHTHKITKLVYLCLLYYVLKKNSLM